MSSKKPFHELLPRVIMAAAETGDFAMFIACLKIVDGAKIPNDHDKITQAIENGHEMLRTELEHRSISAISQLEIEVTDRETEAIEKERKVLDEEKRALDEEKKVLDEEGKAIEIKNGTIPTIDP